MDDFEYDLLQHKLEKLGLSQSEYVRQAITTGQIKVKVDTDPIINNEFGKCIVQEYRKAVCSLREEIAWMSLRHSVEQRQSENTVQPTQPMT